ncbi:MAG: DUF3782 domain-containing protein [Leptolyngbyaceae bacterium]|nr:DUF3782 domain-containing protein [Leptolyngbyaceae bacterium]
MSTTSEEVWQLLRELVQSQQETDRQIQETDRQIKALAQKTDHQLKVLAEDLKALGQETDRRMQETDRRMQETDRQLKELGKQIGGLGAKFGSFTEGLALPSMDRILRQQFGMEYVSPRVRKRWNGEEIEIDVLAYADSDRQAVYVVEVKSHPREEAIAQMKRLLQRFPQFFPEHQAKELYGILAAVSLPEELRQNILAEGLYVARIEDEVFRLDVPEGFEAQSWS